MDIQIDDGGRRNTEDCRKIAMLFNLSVLVFWFGLNINWNSMIPNCLSTLMNYNLHHQLLGKRLEPWIILFKEGHGSFCIIRSLTSTYTIITWLRIAESGILIERILIYWWQLLYIHTRARNCHHKNELQQLASPSRKLETVNNYVQWRMSLLLYMKPQPWP